MWNSDASNLSMNHIDFSAYITDSFGDENLGAAFNDLQLSTLDNSMDPSDLFFREPEMSPEVLTHSTAADPSDADDGFLAGLKDFISEIETSPDDAYIGDTMSIFLEEAMLSALNPQPMEGTECGIQKNPFDDLQGTLSVTVQPQPDLRARYASDGPRFLPNSKKNPMSIGLPDLSTVPLTDEQDLGIVLTMITSTDNPCHESLVHVNDIIYRTDGNINLGNGSIFLPLSKQEITRQEKKFPRLSIICKKFDDYTFDLSSFSTSSPERYLHHYTEPGGDAIGKVAKGKLLVREYNLHCYKIVFQLALKKGAVYTLSNIQCETILVNEQKTFIKGSGKQTSPKRKSSAPKKTGVKTSGIKKAKNSQAVTKGPKKPSPTSKVARKANRPTTIDSQIAHSYPCGTASSAAPPFSMSTSVEDNQWCNLPAL